MTVTRERVLAILASHRGHVDYWQLIEDLGTSAGLYDVLDELEADGIASVRGDPYDAYLAYNT